MSRAGWVTAGVVAVAAVGAGSALWIWTPGFYDWLGSWFIPWAQTPGFGGAAAVVAAIIA